jgi:hypothetical protein
VPGISDVVSRSYGALVGESTMHRWRSPRIEFGEAARPVLFDVFFRVVIATPNAPVALLDRGFAHEHVVGLAV